MTREKLIEVLKLAAEIDPGQVVCAEHDVIYIIEVGACSKEQMAKFKELGCYIDRGVESIAVHT